MSEIKPLKNVEVYSDGACSGNPGPGGWAAILRFGPHEKVLSGNMPHTTNNRMEVFAVISALGALKERCHVRVHSDSTYVVNAFQQGWLANWQRRGWKTSDGKPVENQDLWRLMAIVVKSTRWSLSRCPAMRIARKTTAAMRWPARRLINSARSIPMRLRRHNM